MQAMGISDIEVARRQPMWLHTMVPVVAKMDRQREARESRN